MKLLFSIIIFLITTSTDSSEMIIGEENLSPGIDLIFEGAPKDIIHPKKYFRSESSTDIHIEMLANWSNEAPEGSPIGGFVPYLKVFASIKSVSGKAIRVELTPHLNMSDNLHYAQNIKLPGKIDELYSITFTIHPPENDELGIHFDWDKNIGLLTKKATFIYDDLNFKDIALSSRR